MIDTKVIDVLGPMPVENSCFIILSTDTEHTKPELSKIFAIQCSYADAEVCNGLLNGTVAVNAYEFLTDVLDALQTKVDYAEIENVPPCIFGKMFLKKAGQEKMMKIISSSPCAVINATLAGKARLAVEDGMVQRTPDATVEYHRLKAVFDNLFPLPIIDKTNMLRILSEFIDKVQYIQSPNA